MKLLWVLALQLAYANPQLEKHSLSCAEGTKCPPAVAKLIVFEDAKESQCTAFLVDKKTMVTSRHCMPASSINAGGSCEGKVYAQFAAAEKSPAQTAECKSILSTSANPKPNTIEMQDYAFFEIKEAVDRKPLKLNRLGVGAKERLTLWKVEGLVKSQIKKENCTSIFHTLLWPFAKSPASPTLAFKTCPAEHGSSGGPMLNSRGEAVAILEGISSQQSYGYFKDKFQLKEFNKVQKATNLACVCPVMAGDDAKKSCGLTEECAANLPDGEYLAEGNRIFRAAVDKSKSTIEKGLSDNEKTLANAESSGIRWNAGALFDAEFQENRIRPNSYHYGPTPSCISSEKDLVDGSQEIRSQSTEKFNRFKMMKGMFSCGLKFDLSSHLEVNKASLLDCKPFDFVVSFNTKQIADAKKSLVRVSAVDADLNLNSWAESEVPLCN